jgi:hypothetical protein
MLKIDSSIFAHFLQLFRNDPPKSINHARIALNTFKIMFKTKQKTKYQVWPATMAGNCDGQLWRATVAANFGRQLWPGTVTGNFGQ